MRRVNLIIVIDKDKDNVLMCYRKKDPYKGLYNFVGGKVEPNEEDLDAAYRELHEETGISSDDIALKPLFFSKYFKDALELQVFYGFLEEDISLIKEINPLVWVDLKEDFSDTSKYAGDGNIEHMMSTLISWYQL